MDIELKKYLDEKFGAIDQRFGAIDKRLDAIESRLTSVENIQLRMEHSHGEKLASIFDKIDQFNKHIQDRSIHVNPYPV